MSRVGIFAERWPPRRAVPPALVDAVRARLGEVGLVELTAAIATYNMVARFLVALDIQPEVG